MRVCGMRTGIKVAVSAKDRRQLDAIVADRNSPQKHVWRAQIVLLTADGCGRMELTRRTGTSKTSVWRWQERFMAEGVPGLLHDKTRRPRIPPLGAEGEARVGAATQTAAPGETTHWTSVAMAKHIGISVSSVQRIWRKHGLPPHRVRQFKLSNDPRFAAKLLDIVGLYVNPPEHAIVLSIDEKSQIQALDRTQPGLPMKKGRCGTMTHDYKRNGTTTLFAALNMLDGTDIGECMPRHRHREFLRFLKTIDERTLPNLEPASHRRQLCYPQDPGGKALARAAFALSPALHAHFRLVAQHGRALLRRDHPKAHPPRRLQERR